MESRRIIITWITVTVAVMFALPFAVARLASKCSGMALCMILFFIVNPVYAAILGFRCGRNIRQMWKAINDLARLGTVLRWNNCYESKKS